MKSLFASLSFFLLAGCLTQENQNENVKIVTSGVIGCVPADIVISQRESSWQAMSSWEGVGYWVATCKDKTFVCSYLNKGEGGPKINCTERLK